MKDFILSVIVGIGALLAAQLLIQDHWARQCRLSGYDRYQNGLCYYQSRYIKDLSYTVAPEWSARSMVNVRKEEADYQRGHDSAPRITF